MSHFCNIVFCNPFRDVSRNVLVSSYWMSNYAFILSSIRLYDVFRTIFRIYVLPWKDDLRKFCFFKLDFRSINHFPFNVCSFFMLSFKPVCIFSEKTIQIPKDIVIMVLAHSCPFRLFAVKLQKSRNSASCAWPMWKQQVKRLHYLVFAKIVLVEFC